MKQIPVLLAGTLMAFAAITLLRAPLPAAEAAETVDSGRGPFVMSFRAAEKNQTLIMRMDTRTGKTHVALVPVVLHTAVNPNSQQVRIYWNKLDYYPYGKH